MVLVHSLKIDFKLYEICQNFEIFSINSSKTKIDIRFWKITKLGKFLPLTLVAHRRQTVGPNRNPQLAGWSSLPSPSFHPLNF